jgi:hypothetical protein
MCRAAPPSPRIVSFQFNHGAAARAKLLRWPAPRRVPPNSQAWTAAPSANDAALEKVARNSAVPFALTHFLCTLKAP